MLAPRPDATPEAALRFLQAQQLGIGRGRLRGRGWHRLSRGLYLPAGRPSDPGIELGAFTKVLPRDSGFGHLTSAATRGWWLPHRLGRPPLVFASTTSKVHVQRSGMYVRRSAYTQVDEWDDLPVVSVPETLLELAQDLSLVDLVPMVDCALAGGTSVSDILAAARPRARGAVVLRRAVALADPSSESWWESVLRLLHVVTGLGPVECQVEVRDAAGFVGRADLHLVGTSRYPECDGGEHRDVARHRRDLRRDKALLRLGAERFGYSPAEIAHQPLMIIRDAEDARGLAPDPARAARWWRLARASSLTGHGRARLQARLRRYHRAATR